MEFSFKSYSAELIPEVLGYFSKFLYSLFDRPIIVNTANLFVTATDLANLWSLSSAAWR